MVFLTLSFTFMILQFIESSFPKASYLDLSFMDIVKNAFVKGEKLNLTPISISTQSIEVSIAIKMIP